jgi:hypothetical protein
MRWQVALGQRRITGGPLSSAPVGRSVERRAPQPRRRACTVLGAFAGIAAWQQSRMRHDHRLDDGDHRGRDGHEGQGVDASPDHAVNPGVLMIAPVVIAGDAGSVRVVDNTSSVMIPLVVLAVMCNAVRERCHRRGEAGREQDE